MRFLALLALGLLLAPAAQAADWPQFHADELHTGSASGSFPIPTERWWKATTGGRIDGSPVISDGRVFVASTDGKLYAFDAVTGHSLWVFEAGGPVTTTPALSSGVLYLVTDAGALYAIDAVTGKKRLSAGDASPNPGPTVASPSLHEGRLFVATQGGSVIAYNLATLTQDWSYRPSQEQWVYTNETGVATECRPWGLPDKPIESSPAVYNGAVYFGSNLHNMFAIKELGLGGADSGKTLGFWPAANSSLRPSCRSSIFPELGEVIRGAPAIDTTNGLVIVGSYDNTVRAYDIANGNLVWTYEVKLSGRNSRIIGTPAVVNGKVFFGSFNGRFYALQTTQDKTVQELWDFTAGNATDQLGQNAIWDSPAVSDGRVAFGADNSVVYILNQSNGNVLWTATVDGDDIHGSPAIWNGALYVTDSGGNLYAFGSVRPPRADLAVTSIQLLPTGTLVAGAQAQIAVAISNVGNATSASTVVNLTVDGSLLTVLTLPALAPRNSTTLSYPWTVTAGTHGIEAVIDPDAKGSEYNRANNAFKLDTPTFTSQGGSPTVTPTKKKSPGLEPAAIVVGLALVAMAARSSRRRER